MKGSGRLQWARAGQSIVSPGSLVGRLVDSMARRAPTRLVGLVFGCRRCHEGAWTVVVAVVVCDVAVAVAVVVVAVAVGVVVDVVDVVRGACAAVVIRLPQLSSSKQQRPVDGQATPDVDRCNRGWSVGVD